MAKRGSGGCEVTGKMGGTNTDWREGEGRNDPQTGHTGPQPNSSTGAVSLDPDTNAH